MPDVDDVKGDVATSVCLTLMMHVATSVCLMRDDIASSEGLCSEAASFDFRYVFLKGARVWKVSLRRPNPLLALVVRCTLAAFLAVVKLMFKSF